MPTQSPGEVRPPAAEPRAQAEAAAESRAQAQAASEPRTRPGELTWPLVGIVAGILGALAIAVFFLVVDIAERHAFWTPTALGSALFLGERIAADAQPRFALVLGYTAVHGTFFLAIGLMAAFGLAQRREPLRAVGAIGLVALFFAVFEILILGFLDVASPGLVSAFGALRITLANLLASVVMAGFLTWLAPRVGT